MITVFTAKSKKFKSFNKCTMYQYKQEQDVVLERDYFNFRRKR
jgi:hypothetical protein